MQKREFAVPLKVAVSLFVLISSMMLGSCASLPVLSKSNPADLDKYMGDWQGSITTVDGKKTQLSAQVIALGDGKYQANILEEFDKRVEPVAVLDGTLEGKAVVFSGLSKTLSSSWKDINCQGVIKGGRFSGSFTGGRKGSFEMKKVERISPTMGAKPGQGAIVLFDGKDFDQWVAVKSVPVKWKLLSNAMEVVPKTSSIITKKKFKDYMLHMEFRSPFMPTARGQKRGNSGVYHQGRYEVQILDSYGLAGKDNECGGIYKTAVPRVNMCAPPMQWQSYDIIFRAPRMDSSGNKKENARITVIHNGVMIHDNQELPLPTGGARTKKEQEYGELMLQDHGDKVQYRNIWLVELR